MNPLKPLLVIIASSLVVAVHGVQRVATTVDIPAGLFNADGGAHWFQRSGLSYDLSGVPTGTVTLGGLQFKISSTRSTGFPDVMMLPGTGSPTTVSRINGITIGRTAHAIVFLHAFNPGPAIAVWKQAVSDSLRRGDTSTTGASAAKSYPENFPPEPPTVARYILHYAGGDSVVVNVRFGESIDDWVRAGEFLPPPFADTMWLSRKSAGWLYNDGYPCLGNKVALYGFYLYNPKPSKTIASVSVASVNTAQNDWGAAALLAVSTVNETPAPSVFYIAPGGSATAAGTFDAPWDLPNMGYSITKTIPAGSKVFFRGGTYAINNFINIRGSKSADSVTMFSGYPGETPVIDGLNFITLGYGYGDAGIIAISDSNVTVQCLRIKNSRGSGIRPSGTRVIIRDNVILKAHGPGIWAGRDAKVLGNTVIRACCRYMNTDTVTGSLIETDKNPREQIEMGGAYNTETAFNEICWGDKEGIDINRGHGNRVHHNHLHHFYRKPWINGILINSYNKDWADFQVYNNTVHHVGHGITTGSEGGTPVSEVTIRNNLCYDNAWAGISIGGYGNNIRVLNNTCFRNVQFGINIPKDLGATDSLRMRDVLVRNNICASNGMKQLSFIDSVRATLGHTIDYNLEWPFVLKNPHGANPIYADPKFADTSINDFRILSGSGAINAGHPDVQYNDPDGSRNDVGAFFGMSGATALTPAIPAPRNPPALSFIVSGNLLVIRNSGMAGVKIALFDLSGRRWGMAAREQRQEIPGIDGRRTIKLAGLTHGLYAAIVSDGYGASQMMRICMVK